MTATTDPLRVLIYARFSAEMQSPQSTVDQERECRAFAARETGWRVIGVEKDDAVRAGATAGRAGWVRVRDAAQRRDFDVLLVEEVSRFSRSFLGGFVLLAELRGHGVRFADTKLGIMDLDTQGGQLQAAIALSSSQQETKQLGERSKRGLKGQVHKGFSSGGQPAFGYKRNPIYSDAELDVDGRRKRIGVRFAVDDAMAWVVRLIFQLYADGHTKSAIARHLNERRRAC